MFAIAIFSRWRRLYPEICNGVTYAIILKGDIMFVVGCQVAIECDVVRSAVAIFVCKSRQILRGAKGLCPLAIFVYQSRQKKYSG